MGSFFIWGGGRGCLVFSELEYGVAILKITFVYFWPGTVFVVLGWGVFSKQAPDIYKNFIFFFCRGCILNSFNLKVF